MRFAFIYLLAAGLVGCAAEEESPFPTHWPGEGLAPCANERAAYRIESIQLPNEEVDARDDLGWDLDGDGDLDNHGGGILGAIDGFLEADLASRANDALVLDALHIGLTVRRCGDDGHAIVELLRGTSVDRSRARPRLRAEDTATTLALVAPALPGAAEYGWARFPVGRLLYDGEAEWIDAPRFTVVIDQIDDETIRGRLVAAFDAQQVVDTVTRAFVGIVADLSAARPECVAEPSLCQDTDLYTVMGIFDENEDWDVTEQEVRDNDLMNTLLRPDIAGDGPIWEHLPEDESGLYSIGVGFTASRVDLVIER